MNADEAAQPRGRPGGITDRPRLADVVRDVVAEVAPDELPLVEGLDRLDADRAVQRLARRSRPREPLGFGFGEIAELVTPVVWIAVDETVRRAVDGTTVGMPARVRRVLRRVLRRTAPARTVPPLTREQLTEVRQAVLDLGVRNGLRSERAAALADRVVARLALGERGGGGGAEAARPN